MMQELIDAWVELAEHPEFWKFAITGWMLLQSLELMVAPAPPASDAEKQVTKPAHLGSWGEVIYPETGDFLDRESAFEWKHLVRKELQSQQCLEAPRTWMIKGHASVSSFQEAQLEKNGSLTHIEKSGSVPIEYCQEVISCTEAFRASHMNLTNRLGIDKFCGPELPLFYGYRVDEVEFLRMERPVDLSKLESLLWVVCPPRNEIGESVSDLFKNNELDGWEFVEYDPLAYWLSLYDLQAATNGRALLGRLMSMGIYSATDFLWTFHEETATKISHGRHKALKDSYKAIPPHPRWWTPQGLQLLVMDTLRLTGEYHRLLAKVVFAIFLLGLFLQYRARQRDRTHAHEE